MTMAANLGSMFTPIGNPQNLYLYSLSGLSLLQFLLMMLPYTLGAAVLFLICIFCFSPERKFPFPWRKSDYSSAANRGFCSSFFLLYSYGCQTSPA